MSELARALKLTEKSGKTGYLRCVRRFGRRFRCAGGRSSVRSRSSVRRRDFYPVLLPALISGIVAYMVCLRLGVPYHIPVPAVPALDTAVLGWCILAAVFFGLVCIFILNLRILSHAFLKKYDCPTGEKA